MSTAHASDSAAPQASAKARRRVSWRWWHAVVAIVVLLVIVFVLRLNQGDRLDDTYGRRRAVSGRTSVNGTTILAELFRQAGCKVASGRRLSPAVQRYDVIVWAPDDFTPPTKEQREFLERRWLKTGSGRTLVYIGRDYDAEVAYWKQFQAHAAAGQAFDAARKLARAQAAHHAARSAMPEDEDAGWFRVQRGTRSREIRTLDPAVSANNAEAGWTVGIDPGKLEIEIQGRLLPPETTEGSTRHAAVLLASQDDPLVTRLADSDWSDNQLMVVVNGSFLLNLPLVNHEHRKLAARLVNECLPAESVLFLESGPEPLLVMAEEPERRFPTGLEIFTVWPLGVVMLHLAGLGILYCIAQFPIFGRPRELFQRAVQASTSAVHLPGSKWLAQKRESEQRSPTRISGAADFGNHIEAVGKLLERSGDQVYAVNRLRYYHQFVRRESDSSHAARKTEAHDA